MQDSLNKTLSQEIATRFLASQHSEHYGSFGSIQQAEEDPIHIDILDNEQQPKLVKSNRQSSFYQQEYDLFMQRLMVGKSVFQLKPQALSHKLFHYGIKLIVIPSAMVLAWQGTYPYGMTTVEFINHKLGFQPKSIIDHLVVFGASSLVATPNALLFVVNYVPFFEDILYRLCFRPRDVFSLGLSHRSSKAYARGHKAINATVMITTDLIQLIAALSGLDVAYTAVNNDNYFGYLITQDKALLQRFSQSFIYTAILAINTRTTYRNIVKPLLDKISGYLSDKKFAQRFMLDTAFRERCLKRFAKHAAYYQRKSSTVEPLDKHTSQQNSEDLSLDFQSFAEQLTTKEIRSIRKTLINFLRLLEQEMGGMIEKPQQLFQFATCYKNTFTDFPSVGQIPLRNQAQLKILLEIYHELNITTISPRFRKRNWILYPLSLLLGAIAAEGTLGSAKKATRTPLMQRLFGLAHNPVANNLIGTIAASIATILNVLACHELLDKIVSGSILLFTKGYRAWRNSFDAMDALIFCGSLIISLSNGAIAATLTHAYSSMNNATADVIFSTANFIIATALVNMALSALADKSITRARYLHLLAQLKDLSALYNEELSDTFDQRQYREVCCDAIKESIANMANYMAIAPSAKLLPLYKEWCSSLPNQHKEHVQSLGKSRRYSLFQNQAINATEATENEDEANFRATQQSRPRSVVCCNIL
jgi:hypothetical protein